jgi:hypothetical protein
MFGVVIFNRILPRTYCDDGESECVSALPCPPGTGCSHGKIEGCLRDAIQYGRGCIPSKSKEAQTLPLANEIREALSDGKFQTVAEVQKRFPGAPIETIEHAIRSAGYTVWNGNIETPLPEIVIDLAIWILFCLSIALLVGAILVREQ